MKKRPTYQPAGSGEPAALREVAAVPLVDSQRSPAGVMIRSQIYLTQEEYRFLQSESVRRGEPMAAVIRSFIDEKMSIPDEVWENNPLLQPPVEDTDWNGHEDGAINHDHYIHGCPKKWVRQEGRWVEAPPLPDDYYTNAESKRAYDERMERMT